MNKYWVVFKLSTQNSLAYRGMMFGWMFGNIIGAAVMIFVWQASNSQATIGGYTKPELINYYLVSFFVQWLIGWYAFENVQQEIRQGAIVGKTLLKPISHFWRLASEEAGWHAVSIVFTTIALFVCIQVFQVNFVLPHGLINVVALVLSLVLATAINFSFCLCIGLLALWFSEVHTIQFTLFWGGMSILGGQGIPLSFIPDGFQNLAKLLPYRYAFSFPLEIYFSKVTSQETIFGLLMQIIWVTILVLVYKLLFKTGLKSYSGFGQ